MDLIWLAILVFVGLWLVAAAISVLCYGLAALWWLWDRVSPVRSRETGEGSSNPRVVPRATWNQAMASVIRMSRWEIVVEAVGRFFAIIAAAFIIGGVLAGMWLFELWFTRGFRRPDSLT
jgi:hypothetical protein